MKRIIYVMLCAISISSALYGEKFLVMLDELPGYKIEAAKEYSNYQLDINETSQHGYVVPTNVESIIETDAQVHNRDIAFMFNEAVATGREIYQYWIVMGGYGGGDTHFARFGNDGSTYGKGENEFRIAHWPLPTPEKLTTFRLHNRLSTADFVMSQFNGTSFQTGVQFSYAYAKEKKAAYDLDDLKYMCFSGNKEPVDYRVARIMSFIDVS